MASDKCLRAAAAAAAPARLLKVVARKPAATRYTSLCVVALLAGVGVALIAQASPIADSVPIVGQGATRERVNNGASVGRDIRPSARNEAAMGNTSSMNERSTATSQSSDSFTVLQAASSTTDLPRLSAAHDRSTPANETSDSSASIDRSALGVAADGGADSASVNYDNGHEDSREASDDANNTTLLIEYDQQGYTPVPPSRVASPQLDPGSPIAPPPTPIVIAPTSQIETARQDDGAQPGLSAANIAAAESTRRIVPFEPEAAAPTPSAPAADSGERSYVGAGEDAPAPVAAKLVAGAVNSGDRVVDKSVDGADSRANSTSGDNARDLRGVRFNEKSKLNTSTVVETLLRKNPYSKYWSAEQKWDDIFKRMLAVQDVVKNMILKNFMRDIEYYADLAISKQCADDLKFVQAYAKRSTNFRWLFHMVDSAGKSEPGMLTGNLANLGHPIQCIRVRAPTRPSNDSFDERFFERQTEVLGERFRGKYCLASIRPVLPAKPELASRFSQVLDTSLLSNLSYMGLPVPQLKALGFQTEIPSRRLHELIRRDRPTLDQVPFESELYQYLIEQRNLIFSLPRFMGVCYPSSCSKEDIRVSLQKTVDDQHQVVDIEFECEQEELGTWSWFNTTRLVSYVILVLVAALSVGSSIARYVLVDKMRLSQSRLPKDGALHSIIGSLNLMSMDKCIGILFVKTKQASPIVNRDKIENNRSTSIDALKGFLTLTLVYSELVHLGCLPVPFMWTKWSDAMFPFFRSWATQVFINTTIWSEAFYIISAYVIGLKLLENNRPTPGETRPRRSPDFASFALNRYVRLLLPSVAFLLLNYVWPRLSNGFVLQDQAEKLMRPCDNNGWTNIMLFHNHFGINETCLWPSHVSASFFQLHLLSYPILMLMLSSLKSPAGSSKMSRLNGRLLAYSGLALAGLLAALGIVYPALVASSQNLIVPFLIDYIDYDNYGRVINWMVMPTYNHLTSYMVGLILAYAVARRRTTRDDDDSWYGCYMHRESSCDSMVSSSTQDLKPNPMTNSTSRINSPTPCKSSEEFTEHASWTRRLFSLVASGLFTIVLLMTLTASWYWNGLGQPMTSSQTFWYVALTKLVFSVTFAYLFHKHFATRRNSTNPWIVTRFLVPIGRMSLTVFYVSWIVIWFDLLSSLYQWHPSHYFVFEKYNEIIFMTLILAMFVYGAFEGVVKNILYSQLRLELDRLDSENDHGKVQQEHLLSLHRFEGMFSPSSYELAISELTQGKGSTAHQMREGGDGQLQGDKLSHGIDPVSSKPQRAGVRQHQMATLNPSGKKIRPMMQQLSIADQCKLNAELRANYSFASIGLYELAGATSDLTHSGSQQASPKQSQKGV